MSARRKQTDEELSIPVGSSLLTPLDVRRMRVRCGLFLRELADTLSVSLAYVQHWEAGRRPIPNRYAAHLHSLHKQAMEGDYMPLRKRDPRKRLLKTR